MKEPHSEGVAHHTDPESCGDPGDSMAEALTGENACRFTAMFAQHLNRGVARPFLVGSQSDKMHHLS